MDNQPERNTGEAPSHAELETRYFQEVANQLAEQMRIINTDTTTSQEQKNQALKDLSAEKMKELKQNMTAFENIRKSQPEDKTKLTEEAKKQEQEAKKGVREAFVKTIAAASKELELSKDKKVQAILSELGKAPPNMEQAGRIVEKLGAYFTGEKPIIITKQGEEKSDFMKAVDSLHSEDAVAFEQVRGGMENRAESFAMTKEAMREAIKPAREELIKQAKKAQAEDIRERMWGDNLLQYYGRFSPDQQEFLHTLYTPEGFKDYVEDKVYGKPEDKETVDKIKEQKNDIKQEIIDFYHEQDKDIPSEQELNRFTDERWRQEVSHRIEGELGGVLNQLLLRLQLEGANKPFDELANEDFMHGIRTTESAIRNVLQTLQKNLEAYENDPDYQIKLYKMVDQGYYAEEREVEIDKKTGKMRNVPYPRMIPLLQPKEVSLKDFIIQLNIDMTNLIDERNYLHDSRVAFNSSPGKDGFYSGLAGYAEKYKGVDIDHLSLLPDGDIALEAYYLYEKYLEEDMASIDWRTRPNMFTPEIGSANTQLENQIIRQMMLEYGKKNYSEDRIRAAINIGVGMARGVFLTEPEKSSYCDPVDEKGQGMVASYGTNDAGALNALNPLHVELRWQGEHHMFMYYFMPITGEPGKLWDHRKMSDNMGKYLDSYIKGKGNLPDDLFINKVIGTTKAGGPFTRRGWRMDHTLEGYFKYKDVDLGNGKKLNIVDGLETFKAINYLGYEPIYHFLTQEKIGKEVLSAKEGTVLGEQRKALFRYIYNCYFKDFDGPDFDGYMKSLRKEGEDNALEAIKKSGSAPGGWEAQVESAISGLFLKRAVTRVVALRFPSKFLRIDRSRFEKDGVSRWQKVQQELGMSRDEFNAAMKDFAFVEVLLRKEMSKTIKDQLHLAPKLELNELKLDYDSINEETIGRLLSKTEGFRDDKMTPERIDRVKRIYRQIKKDFFNNKKLLNEEGWKAIKEYPFSFGVEDTALDLMAFRATGPRMVARAIADTGFLEQGAVPVIKTLGRMLQQIAIDGKHDFSPIIEAMAKARDSFEAVHDSLKASEFNYKIATAVIQYFKKDSLAKPLFGIFGIGKINSMAAMYAGRSTAVWEWDSRDIDRFIVALESYRLIPKTYYDIFKVKEKNAEYENIYWINPITKKPFKTPFKKYKTDYEWNAKMLREQFGGTYGDIMLDWVNMLLPVVGIYILWKYIQDALKETEGKKK
jgi:hypothetical protein